MSSRTRSLLGSLGLSFGRSSLRPASLSPRKAVRPRPTPRSVALRAVPAPAAVKVLVAGVDKDTRAFLERSVREAVGRDAARGPCTVSLVKLGEAWSVTIDGPGELRHNLTLHDDSLLAVAVRDAIVRPAVPPPPAPVAAKPEDAPAFEARDSHLCPHCRNTLVVVYQTQADEPKEPVPIACPHCWKLGHVEVGAWAAAGHDYRCDKA